MFEDLVKKYAMEDEIKPSKKRIKANCSALRSLIEQEENMNNNRKSAKIFKKPFALAATIAICVCLTGITAFAASNGLFSSIKKAFYNDDNALRASEPSEYAFVPDVDSITGDGVTINVTEAIADSHGIRIFMDMIYEDGIPQEVFDCYEPTVDNHYSSLIFENYVWAIPHSFSTTCVSVENNVISLYITADGIQVNEWEKDGFTIGIENFGYYLDSKGDDFHEFKTISDISETINIPPEQIKRNGSETSYADVDGVNVKMELSLLGINMVFNSIDDYDKIIDKLTYPGSHGMITPTELGIYMKDGMVYGHGENMGKAMDTLGGGSGGIEPDGSYYRYIKFNLPVDIENIEKIILNDYEFCFE